MPKKVAPDSLQGVGKTHLTIALAARAFQNGYSIYFSTLDSMIRELAAADRSRKLDRKAGLGEGGEEEAARANGSGVRSSANRRRATSHEKLSQLGPLDL